MNTYNNKRRQDTIKRIEDVFLEHIKTRELTQIKVSNICKDAKINRSTFYANFMDVYELADRILARLEGEVLQVLEKDTAWNYSGGDFLRLFQHIQEHQMIYRCYFKLGYDSKCDIKLYDFCIQEYDINIEHLEYHIEFFKNGFNAIVKKWLDGGCQETPQQMRDILMGEYGGRANRR